MFGALLYAKLFSIPILVSYHTHIPQYIPQYTWAGLVEPMWKLIRFCVRAADVTLVVSSQSKVLSPRTRHPARPTHLQHCDSNCSICIHADCRLE